MRRHSVRPSRFCVVVWTKAGPRATSYFHEPDRFSLDAGPLGTITNPKSSPENEACRNWLARLACNGGEIAIPEIADYEVRREPLRSGKERGLGRLQKPPSSWATARKTGRQSADDASLDAGMTLAAQAGAFVRAADDTVIATTNIRHLALFASARIWREMG